MSKSVIVSQMDIQHLEIIRASVSSFIKSCAQKFDKQNTKLLDIAPQVYQGASQYFKSTTIETLDIDTNAETTYHADICEINDWLIPSQSFDYILCTEVLEHTMQPFKAVEEMARILKPGGLLFLTVPFNLRIHGPLPDCWRFTEHGLRAILKNFTIEFLNEIPTEGRDLMPIHYQLIAKKNCDE